MNCQKILKSVFTVTKNSFKLPVYIVRVQSFSTKIDEESAQLEQRIQDQYEQHVLKFNESPEKKRARLLWQSRKRGIAENCLLFGTFSQKYLDKLTDDQLVTYDRILNDYLNEWDLYYWMVGTKEVPKAYQTDIMDMLIKHAQNEDREKRFKQPDLPEKLTNC